MSNKLEIANRTREKFIKELAEFYGSKDEEVLRVSGNKILIPTLHDNGDDAWVQIMVSVPRGSKGEEFDGYEQAKEYQEKLEEKKTKNKTKKRS